MKKKLSVYVHIPFCVKKCDYCDFLSGSASQQRKKEYVEALLSEIAQSNLAQYEVASIFIGGGTPSILEAQELERILNQIRETFAVSEQAEISIEINPGTASCEKLAAYRMMGINRISIGVQSLQDAELRALGRIHDAKEFFQTWEWAKQAGFQNRNVDLMSGIPQQSLESLQDTLTQILALRPEHISAYSLIIEEGTPFAARYPDGAVSEELDREMYLLTGRLLREAGYHRYEISNYAREGYECRHNKAYWTRQDYIGFGIGAASLIENTRFSDTRSLEDYISFFTKKNKAGSGRMPCGQKEMLSRSEQMAEMMFLGLRLMEGVCLGEFEKLFGVPAEHVYGEVIRKHEAEELLVRENGYLRLTERGIDVSNYVMADFLSD